MMLPKWLTRLFNRNPMTVVAGDGTFDSPFEMANSSPCPSCKANLDAATKFAGPAGGPKPGDLSVCFYCGSMLEFDASLRLKFIDTVTWDSLPIDVKQSMIAAASMTERQHGRDVKGATE